MLILVTTHTVYVSSRHYTRANTTSAKSLPLSLAHIETASTGPQDGCSHGHSGSIDTWILLENGPEVKLYTGIMCLRVILKNFILSKKVGKAYYLYSGIATYIGSRKELKETE